MSPIDIEIPKELQRNPHFARYFRTWQRNELSIVFIPLAQICREQGFLEMACQICEKGLSRHPGSVSGRLMLARIFIDMEREEKAKEIVEKVLQEYPAQQEAEALLHKLKRMEEPEPAKKSSKSVEPEETSVSSTEEVTEEAAPIASAVSPWENPTMAKIYADQGETKIAHQILDKILARDPQNVRASELKRSLSA
ncbi:MAG TPA: tetratricopeptide repeat protein [bacterium]|nr:tetratricopeptide repeat protein [bacterium]